ncbi:MAG: FtsH protease activity modulator HflK [Gammaproteobacteria bacterium]|nr:MAG: FtsH protease activity modulator HflK [Gammaproteobacteria bacterium]
MAWNEPGNGNKDKDPWGNKGNRNNQGGGPPDLEEMLKNLWKQVMGSGSGGNKKGNAGGTSIKSPISKAGLYILLFIIVAVYLLSGFYTVDEKERGVVLRFGAYHDTVGSGLHWLPKFIDRVEKVDISSIERTSVEGIMLTKDENIVIVRLGVQYRIDSPKDYLFNVTSPEGTITQAAESALRAVVGNAIMDDIITTGREVIKSDTLVLLEKIMESYNTGLIVTEVTLEEADAPSQVKAAFQDAIKAREDEERYINTAQSYENQVVPLAEGNAAKALEIAKAYEESAIAKALGDVAKFEKLLPEYHAAPEVTRQRLYIETMERVYSRVNKVIIDVEGGNNMMYLPLDQLIKNNRTSTENN